MISDSELRDASALLLKCTRVGKVRWGEKIISFRVMRLIFLHDRETDASFGTVTANDKWIYWTAFSVLCEIDCGNQGYQFYSHNTIEDKCMCYNKSPIRGNRALIPSQGTLSGGPGTCEELAKCKSGMKGD